MPKKKIVRVNEPVSLIKVSVFLFFLVGRILARHVHVIPLPSPKLHHPSAFAWDPSSQHFLLGSRHRHSISSVSDAGVVQTLIFLDSSSSSISAVSVDDSRRRIIAASSSPATISSFDLRSPVPHRQLFSSPLPDPAASISAVSVDPSTGAAFIATSTGEILTADLDGKISTLAAHVSKEVGGLAHVSRGFLLVVDKDNGGILKVDDEDGTAKRGLMTSSALDAVAVAVRRDGAAVVVRWVKSNDGCAEAAVHDQFSVSGGQKIEGVAIREGKMTYVLIVNEEKGSSRIEEVAWEMEGEGEGEMVWAMVLIGLGLAYFMYWRLQMGKLISGVNKKRL